MNRSRYRNGEIEKCSKESEEEAGEEGGEKNTPSCEDEPA